MLVLAVVGVVLNLLLVGVLYAFAFATLWHFGNGQPQGIHCPACQRDGLHWLPGLTVARGRMTMLQCCYCRAAYRVQDDGTLAAMS